MQNEQETVEISPFVVTTMRQILVSVEVQGWRCGKAEVYR
jgi:hypothetical protein